MADFQSINALFDKQEFLPKYKHKRWVKIQDNNINNYEAPIKYNCKNVQDKLVDYRDGYVLLTGQLVSTTNDALAAGNNIGIKNGSNCVVKTATVYLNNVEINKNHHVYLTTNILNLVEYSDDYARSTAEQYAFAKDSVSDSTSTGLVRRNIIARGAFADHAFPITIMIPLSYMNTFFRRLECPIINNLVEIEWEGNFINCILRANDVQASRLNVISTELYLPIIELPKEYESKMFSLLSKKLVKELTWDHLNVHIISGWTTGHFDREITSSLNGVRKMFVMAIPEANWINQTRSETTTNTAISNINVVIDSEDYYPQDVRTDYEAYQLLTEVMNAQGRDVTTGSLISYSEFKILYRIYGFDLSRQRVLESDPRKSQSIRLRGDLPPGNSKLVVILSQNKTTFIDMVEPYNTKTI